MTNKLPVRITELTDKEAKELKEIGFNVYRISHNLYLITFKETVQS